jgi:hypothetical protein
MLQLGRGDWGWSVQYSKNNFFWQNAKVKSQRDSFGAGVSFSRPRTLLLCVVYIEEECTKEREEKIMNYAPVRRTTLVMDRPPTSFIPIQVA